MICGSEMTYEEAATALGCSVGTIKSRMWRARTRMKELLLEGDDDDDGTPPSRKPTFPVGIHRSSRGREVLSLQ